MRFDDLRKKSEKELRLLLSENREKVRDLRFKLASRQLKDVRSLRKLKRQIAQVLTLLNQKKKSETSNNSQDK